MNLYSVRIGLAVGLLAISATQGMTIYAQQSIAKPTVQADTTIPSPVLL